MTPPSAPSRDPQTLRAVFQTVPRWFLGPGEIHASRAPCLISTILGSCVAVCLHDPIAEIGGMNHIVLPFLPAGHAPSARQGDYAITALVERMLNLGADESRLRAKIFGGGGLLARTNGHATASPADIGQRNVALTRQRLRDLSIPIDNERVLGTTGIVTRMLTTTGDVWIRSMENPPADSHRTSHGPRGRLTMPPSQTRKARHDRHAPDTPRDPSRPETRR
ncbi:chemotaxis protein CheD [Roseospira marina]|uniref:Probable chemoreceptor glutamine deamidase CheD n=1 Tax=Roseospira marina TaxID=140057 RepID=A0A5M6I8R4_9PROT|nr:chemotaxis protein CheD [Roseospira marina]KAA5604583.1 chemotaxis protein CheD [Roseospira marina]MBB4315333.1 chemotaxis protein CheD [Roseospira marina]MBB5088332.1 chemotaxis protein CheD [Roseospira marina]